MGLKQDGKYWVTNQDGNRKNVFLGNSNPTKFKFVPVSTRNGDDDYKKIKSNDCPSSYRAMTELECSQYGKNQFPVLGEYSTYANSWYGDFKGCIANNAQTAFNLHGAPACIGWKQVCKRR